MLGKAGECFVDCERLVQPRQRLVRPLGGFLVRRLLAGRGPTHIDAEPPRQLGEPRLDRLVLAQVAQPLVGAREYFLVDVFRVGIAETEALNRDRVDVTGEAVDELAPGVLVAVTAAGDQLCVRLARSCHVLILTSFGLEGNEPVVRRALYAPRPMVVVIQRVIGEEDLLRRGLAEFVGTFALVFVAAGAIAAASLSGDIDPSSLTVAFAYGLVVVVMVSALGHISGGHFNPAITLAFFVTRRLTVSLTIAYLVVQLAAAAGAALLIRWIFPGESAESVGYGAPAIDPDLGTAEALVVEALLTFFLVWVVFATAADIRGTFRAIAGLGIGLAITFGVLVGDPLTDAMMNPARAFGPQLIDGSWDDFWVWYAGPILGGAIAALVYELVYLRTLEPEPVGVEGTGVDEPGPGTTALP